jgi:hypothetical protein
MSLFPEMIGLVPEGKSGKTVTRWRTGKAVPHPVLRPMVFKRLLERVEKIHG